MLAQKAKYAIKALIYLAQQSDRNLVATREIAQEANIPKKFLEHILSDLKRAGLTGSKAGKEGGYFLLKKPREINLAQIHRIFDGAIALLPCASENFYRPCDDCPNPKKCSIKDAIGEIRSSTLRKMEQITIAKMME